MNLSSIQTTFQKIFDEKYKKEFKDAYDSFSALAMMQDDDETLFRGGRRTFASLDAIQKDYDGKRDILKNAIYKMRDEFIADLKKEIPRFYELDADIVNITQTKLSACATSADVKRICAASNGNFTILSTVSAYKPDDENSYCRTAQTALRKYQASVDRCIKGVNDACNMLAENWRSRFDRSTTPNDLIDSEISHVGDAYDNLMNTFKEGSNNSRSFLDFVQDHVNPQTA